MATTRSQPDRSSRFPLWVVILLGLIVVLLAITTLTLLSVSAQHSSMDELATRLEGLSQKELELEKLRQETLELRLQNDRSLSFWQVLPTYATFLTALVAIVGTFATIWRQIGESRRHKEIDRQQRELDRQQRETESRRRLDEKFTAIITNLGAESPAVRASAAVSIETYLRPEYVDFHEQAYSILVANLRIQHDEAINHLLVEAFEKAIRLKLAGLDDQEDGLPINLSRCQLYGVDLAGLDLREADLGFANLQTANLTGTNLWRARGIQATFTKARLSRANLNEARLQKALMRNAYFHGTNLVSADLKEANLYGAQFEQARLQAAHLHRTNLVDARFEQANLADTYFLGAKLNEAALRSILKALNWPKAHFDPPVRERLEELAGSAT